MINKIEIHSIKTIWYQSYRVFVSLYSSRHIPVRPPLLIIRRRKQSHISNQYKATVPSFVDGSRVIPSGIIQGHIPSNPHWSFLQEVRSVAQIKILVSDSTRHRHHHSFRCDCHHYRSFHSHSLSHPRAHIRVSIRPRLDLPIRTLQTTNLFTHLRLCLWFPYSCLNSSFAQIY